MTAEERKEQIAQMSKTIFQYCLTRTSSFQEAEDLSQDILLECCKSVDNLRDEKAFYAFIWRIADNVLKAWYRKCERSDECEIDESVADTGNIESEEKALENEQLALIKRELAMLCSSYRRAMVEYYINDRSVAEVSALFSISESMVKYILFQSRKKIRKGVNMERNYGTLSFAPVELGLRFWGENSNYYYHIFDSKVRQNIVMACYYEKQTEEQLSLQTGVPTAYFEDDIKKLLEYDLLIEKNGYYRSNIVIITKDELDEISRKTEASVNETVEFIRSAVDGIVDDVRKIGFYGSDMSLNSVKWMTVSQLLHLAYIDMLQSRPPMDDDDYLPKDKFGQNCVRWLTEENETDKDYGFGKSSHSMDKALIMMFDVPVNGEFVHSRMSGIYANMLVSLMNGQPQSENDRLVCSEMIKQGFAIKTDDGIRPNFPCFDKEQGARFAKLINAAADKVCDQASGRLDDIAKIVKDHAPTHLREYAEKLVPFVQYSEISNVMRTLCESGWLLPYRQGMLPTTVMYLY